MTIYYVSSGIGSNNNAGTSASAPLASLQAAANLTKPGDTVQVMTGSYTAPFYGDALDITTSGTANAPITFEAAPGQSPIIDSSGGWNAINIKASYIVIKGFTVVGDAANYNLQSALAGYNTGSSSLNGNGIAVNPGANGAISHHITIENNTVYNEPGGGIYTENADYVQILNNVVHNNANWAAFGNSGISMSTSANSDNKAGLHNIISGNLVYNNAQLVPTNGAGAVTDGEGIILDTNPNYTGGFLVQNNTVYGNGGPGIESFLSSNATITGNKIYGNNTQNTQARNVSEIFINQSANNTVTNNDTSNPSLAAPVVSNGVLNANDSVTLTGTALAGSTVTVLDGTNTLGSTVASAAGAWSFTSLILVGGSHTFKATDTTSIGTSVASNALSVTVPTNASNTQTPATPVISTIAENPNESITLTGTAVANSTVTVWSTTGTNVGSSTASSSGAWSYTTPVLNSGIYGYYATDTTPGGTSARSNALGTQVGGAPVTPPPAPPTAPVISAGAVNSDHSITLTGTAPAGATVIVSNGGANPLGTTTANSTGAWRFTTADLSAGAYAFTATDTTSAGTSAKSSAFNVTVPTATAPLPAAPVISKIAVNSNHSLTLTGTAVANSTVTVWSTTGNNVGTSTASSTGAWSFTTPVLLPSVYGYAATDTTAAGTSAKSNALGVTVPAQSFSANGKQYGQVINLTATSDELVLTASDLTITRGSGTESLKAGASVFPFNASNYRSTETINTQSGSGDHFIFGPQFGHETIQGFNALGSEADTLQLSISSFSYLNTGMSQSSDLEALLTHSSGTSSTTITDSSGDTLTLAGLSHSTLAAAAATNTSLFKFV